MKFTDKLFTIITLLIAFGCYQAAAPQLHAQSYKISADEPTPGGGGTSQSDDSGNEGLYIGLGLAAAALIGYVIYTKFKKSDNEDSTSTSSASLNNLIKIEKNSFANSVRQLKEQLPVDLYFGVKNQNVTIPERIYSFGIAYRF